MKTVEEKGGSKSAVKKPAKRLQHKSEELKTDPPLSEKDEVKRAEQNMRKNIGK
ncbi:MAG TPA: hypothetical protein VK668_13790 [Mucilaginibacter sp.]|nr:hypothetical protein [Mucilaginibacter sp.]